MKFLVEIPDKKADKMLREYLNHMEEGNYADALRDLIVTSDGADYLGLLYDDVYVEEQ